MEGQLRHKDFAGHVRASEDMIWIKRGEKLEEKCRHIGEFLKENEIGFVSSEFPPGEQGQSYLVEWCRKGMQDYDAV